jgi:hypothetical protein
MELRIGNSIISSYKRLSYTAWYAFAEFVDNSTQAYFHHKEELDRRFAETGEKLRIDLGYYPNDNLIIIRDNSIGMDEETLKNAMVLGQVPDDPNGRSRYGLGMKTAACWFGDYWVIETKRLGETTAHQVTVDVKKIAKENITELPHLITENQDPNKHGTTILISALNRKFHGKTLRKIREFLGSMYRYDFSGYGLQLYWNDDLIKWHAFDDRLLILPDGTRAKKTFEFEINNKAVKGWVGVLGKGHGSRKHAGFSIIQNNRVIQGWPDSYKPATIFGEQEDGSNNLVNQRVIGELVMESFSVSHTKDKIVWEDDEEDLLDKKLGEVCAEYKVLASTTRYEKEENPVDIVTYTTDALFIFESELKSSELTRYLNNVKVYPEKILKLTFDKARKSVEEEVDPSLEVKLGVEEDTITVKLYFSQKTESDPYVLVEMTVEDNTVIVVINMLHPHYRQMQSSEAVLNFIRHCVYDGVSEWKATKVRGELKPYTIKFIKDGLLRVPLEIMLNQVS